MFNSISAEDLQKMVKLHAPEMAKKHPIFNKVFLTKNEPNVERLSNIIHGACHIIWEQDELVSEELRQLRDALNRYQLKGTV